MKKLKKIILLLPLIVALICTTMVFASNNSKKTTKQKVLNQLSKTKLEYTEEFQKWLTLTKAEQAKTIQPQIYDFLETLSVSKNPINIATNVESATLSKYSLHDIIPENTVVRNQKSTQSCWAFANIGALESTLGLADYYNSKSVTKYDYSERHMVYATTRLFLNNQVNQYGFNKTAATGGNYYMAVAYLTNGLGPIKELEMPFEDNEDVIDISEIQNKTTSAVVYDTTEFGDYSSVADKTEIIQRMKEYIKQYGGISAAIYGASPLFDDYCNKETGAIYCDDATNCPINHNVLVIGWDDDYSRENFVEEHRPTNNGAWIIKNSWGERLEYSFDELKEILYENYADLLKKQYNWNSASEISDEYVVYVFEQVGLERDGNQMVCKIGDNGIMYVSYEDVNIYYLLSGIDNASSEVDYDNIYQYNYFNYDYLIGFTVPKVYVANVYTREDISKTEYLTRIALSSMEEYTCKVYVNANSDSKDFSDLKEVKLKAGDSETNGRGYHSLEFAEPIELTGDKFVVMVEITGTRSDGIYLSTEAKIDNSYYDVIEISENTSFWTTDAGVSANEWIAFSDLDEMTSGYYPNMNSTLKAFTSYSTEKTELTSIEIQTPPTKTEYVEGQNFETTGMVVIAKYSDGTSKEITSYTIEDGINLKLGQTEVTIKYDEKTVKQKITVTAKKEESSTDTEQAVGTDFTNANCSATSIKAFYYTDTSKKEYITMNLEVSKIERKSNDSYEYYYYLSDSATEKNITDWVKITSAQNSDTSLSFTANTSNLSNYSELMKAEKIYLYIKEKSVKGTSEVLTTSNAILINSSTTVEIYKDNVKQTTNNSNNNNNNNNSNNGSTNNNSNTNTTKNTNTTTTTNTSKTTSYVNTSSNDNTLATSTLPKTGLKFTITLLVSGTIIAGVYFYIKYKKMGF